MVFEFNHQLLPQNILDIGEIGEFAIEACNDEQYYWYMVARSILGTTIIATCGPVIPDVAFLPSGFSMTLDKVPYKEEKIAKAISMFLNDRKKGITDAKVIDVIEGIDQFRELKDYLKDLREETF